MNLDEYARLDAVDLANLVATKEVKPEELSALALRGAERVNDQLNAIIEVFPERASGESIQKLPKGPLFGVPNLNKDLGFMEKGILMELGSELAKGIVAQLDSEIVVRLRNSGIVTLGRTTTSELGISGVTENRLSGVTRNPWDVTRITGGSSGGAAAVVAAGVVPIATASDGGGSIRDPAALCGTVGLKPSRGRISMGPEKQENLDGLSVAFAVTRTVRDTAKLLDCLHGPMAGDPYQAPQPSRPYIDEVGAATGRLRIAYTTKPWNGAEVHPEVYQGVEKTIKFLESEGHFVEEAHPVFNFDAFFDATITVWCAHTAANGDRLAELTGRSASIEYLQSSSLAMYEHGKKLTATAYIKARSSFNDLCRHTGWFFENYDLLITPTSSQPPRPIGEFVNDSTGPEDVLAFASENFRDGSFQPLFNTTGQPAISLPLHETRQGLPVGVQIAGRFGDEAGLIRIASTLESALPWRHRRPSAHVART